MEPENASRWVRNNIIKEQLRKGFRVQFLSSQGSMWPLYNCGDAVLLEPISSESDLLEGDIVFCEVQPGNRFYCHEIQRINYEAPAGPTVYTISNNKGTENGWCYIEHIYGRVIEVIDVLLPLEYVIG